MLSLSILTALGLVAPAVVAAWIARGSVLVFLLATWLLLTSELVVVAWALSATTALTRTGYSVALVVTASLAAMAFVIRRPPPLEISAVGAALRSVASDATVAALAALTGVVLVYEAALGALTAPNDDDALTYHLARPAFWLQNDRVSPLAFGEDVRLSAFPPTGELLSTFVLAASDSDRYVSWINIGATLALCGGVVLIARQVGLGRVEAVFGGLITATYPIVALQAGSTLTDVLVAAFVVNAVAFMLVATPAAVCLGSLALALAMSTKVTGLLAVPAVAAVALTRLQGRWRPGFGAGLVAATGLYWYVANLARTGDIFGDFPKDQRGDIDPVTVVGRVLRTAINIFDLPGAYGWDRLVFPIAGVALALLLIVTGRVTGVGRIGTFVAGAVVAGAPLVLLVGEAAQRVFRKAWFVVGQPEIGVLDSARDEAMASTMQSGAGAVGAVVATVGLGLAWRHVRQRSLPPVALALAAAPIAWLVLVGAAVTYFPWNARFVLPGFALAAATAGLILRVRPLAWGLVGIAAVTTLLATTHSFEKPSGLRLLEPPKEQSVFAERRCETAGIRAGMAPVSCFISDAVPEEASLASFPFFFPENTRDPYLAQELFVFPLFGPSLDRKVSYALTPTEASGLDSEWYAAPTESLERGCIPGWRRVFTSAEPGWTVLQAAPVNCK